MSVWQGEFLPVAVKGLKDLKKDVKPDSTTKTVVKKDIEKTRAVEKIPASAAENLLKKKLVDKQFELLFADMDPRLLRVLSTELLDDADQPLFKEAAIQAKIHLENTYGKYAAANGNGGRFSTVAALAPFSGGELSQRDRAAAKLYMWFLYGANQDLAYEVFKNIMNRESGSTDLADFIGKNDRMYDGKPLLSLLEQHNWILEEVIYHSFSAVESVVRTASVPIMHELISVVLQLSENQLSLSEKEKAFLILVAGNRVASSIGDTFRDDFYALQQSLAKAIFTRVEVDKTRRMYATYPTPQYWLSLVKLLVPLERISADNLIFLVSELQRRNALADADEAELLDAANVLELTRTLDNATIDQSRRQGFTFRA